MFRTAVIATLALAAGTMPAFAHLDPVEHGSFVAGFTHPLFGADHVLAMVAVGLWATIMGGRALWLVPAAFVGAMVLGFIAAAVGMPLFFVEPVILASVVVIGLLVASAFPVPAAAGMALVGFFALFHGHAHGGEMGQAGTFGYALGFIAATGLLHMTGIAVGTTFGSRAGVWATRVAGTATALAGVWLAAGV